MNCELWNVRCCTQVFVLFFYGCFGKRSFMAQRTGTGRHRRGLDPMSSHRDVDGLGTNAAVELERAPKLPAVLRSRTPFKHHLPLDIISLIMEISRPTEEMLQQHCSSGAHQMPSRRATPQESATATQNMSLRHISEGGRIALLCCYRLQSVDLSCRLQGIEMALRARWLIDCRIRKDVHHVVAGVNVPWVSGSRMRCGIPVSGKNCDIRVNMGSTTAHQLVYDI